MGKIKTRLFPESNYKSIFLDGKTIRIALDPSKAITELEFAEFYDVAVNDRCTGGCHFCYTSALNSGENFKDVPEKIYKYFGSMSENEKPYQVAIGGSGEATIHPDFAEVLKAFHDVGVMPNYTSHGLWALSESKSQKILDPTLKYSGGVAISAHPQFDGKWEKAVERLIEAKVKTNIHIVLGGKTDQQIDRGMDIYDKWIDKVDYVVLLPLMKHGFSKEQFDDNDWKELKKRLPSDTTKVAFGAHFHPYLVREKSNMYNVSLYEPEIMSKYLSFKDNGYLYPSSFKTDVILKQNFIK